MHPKFSFYFGVVCLIDQLVAWAILPLDAMEQFPLAHRYWLQGLNFAEMIWDKL
jgi:hypothetical protein